MPFTAIEEKLAELTTEVHAFNEQAPQLRKDVKDLRQRGAAVVVVGAIALVGLLAAVVICFSVIRDAKHDREVNSYQSCLRGNGFRKATITGFDITFKTVIGPKPSSEAPQAQIDEWNRNNKRAEDIVEAIAADPAFTPVTCVNPD